MAIVWPVVSVKLPLPRREAGILDRKLTYYVERWWREEERQRVEFEFTTMAVLHRYLLRVENTSP
jgi:hypothetical protein